jgi:hypothetical protein
MSKRTERHPDVPYFQSTRLDAIAAALGRRAKAIKAHSRKFASTRELTGEGERLDLEMETNEAHPTRLRLSVWEDGAVWLSVHQSDTWRRGGWAFQLTGRGDASQVESTALVAMVEETRAIVYGDARALDVAERIDAIWASAHFQRELSTRVDR